MICTEKLTINGREFIKTYSDENRYIIQNGTGIAYGEAVDPAHIGRTYTEGDVMESHMTEVEEKAIAYDILMGAS